MKKSESRFLRHAVVLFAALGAAIPASAGTGYYIGVEGGINNQGEQHVDRNDVNFLTYDFKDGYVFGLNFGYGMDNGLRPEVGVDFRKNKFESLRSGSFQTNDVGGDENAWNAMGNLWYDFRRPEGIFATMHPYLGGGIGAARVESHDPTFVTTSILLGTRTVSGDSVSATVFAYQGGAGVYWDASPATSFSVDYRHLETGFGTFDSSAGSLRARYRSNAVMLGLRHSFGEAPPPPPPPEPVAVLPVDSDGDGVFDDSDKCPNTPKGFKVDATGCIVQQSIILRGINFVFDSDQLTQPAQETLDEVAAALAGQPTLTVQIVGHTDNVGTEQYNNTLSQKRADAVRTYLIGKAVKPENLQAHGAGESTPISDNESEEGRAENRRVEFIVVDKPADVKVNVEAPTEQSKSAAEAGEPANLKQGQAATPAPATTATPASTPETSTEASPPAAETSEPAAATPATSPESSTPPAESAAPSTPAEASTTPAAESTATPATPAEPSAGEAQPATTDTTSSSPAP